MKFLSARIADEVKFGFMTGSFHSLQFLIITISVLSREDLRESRIETLRRMSGSHRRRTFPAILRGTHAGLCDVAK